MKHCQACRDNDPTVAYRERMPKGQRILCAPCYLDANASNTVALPLVALREYNDRYSQMAERYGVR